MITQLDGHEPAKHEVSVRLGYITTTSPTMVSRKSAIIEHARMMKSSAAYFLGVSSMIPAKTSAIPGMIEIRRMAQTLCSVRSQPCSVAIDSEVRSASIPPANSNDPETTSKTLTNSTSQSTSARADIKSSANDRESINCHMLMP